HLPEPRFLSRAGEPFRYMEDVEEEQVNLRDDLSHFEALGVLEGRARLVAAIDRHAGRELRVGAQDPVQGLILTEPERGVEGEPRFLGGAAGAVEGHLFAFEAGNPRPVTEA